MMQNLKHISSVPFSGIKQVRIHWLLDTVQVVGWGLVFWAKFSNMQTNLVHLTKQNSDSHKKLTRKSCFVFCTVRRRKRWLTTSRAWTPSLSNFTNCNFIQDLNWWGIRPTISLISRTKLRSICGGTSFNKLANDLLVGCTPFSHCGKSQRKRHVFWRTKICWLQRCTAFALYGGGTLRFGMSLLATGSMDWILQLKVISRDPCTCQNFAVLVIHDSAQVYCSRPHVYFRVLELRRCLCWRPEARESGAEDWAPRRILQRQVRRSKSELQNSLLFSVSLLAGLFSRVVDRYNPKNLCWATLNHVQNGKNFFSGKRGMKVAFLSFHRKVRFSVVTGIVRVQLVFFPTWTVLSPNLNQGNEPNNTEVIMAKEMRTYEYLKKHLQSLVQIPFYNE